ncbi:MAG: hypothetical protein CSB48_12755 [Proteobacteria bacterium]|nr:MAG: hypothetical protein CSB48_12755 [Pseudomonadota bacterium]
MPIDINGVILSHIHSPGKKGAASGARVADSLRDRRDQDEQRAADQHNRNVPERIDYNAIQRKVEAKSETREVNLQRQRAFEELPGRNQKALAAYSETANLSSSSNGGELVGVDIFV